MLHNMETHTPEVCCTLETIDTNTGYPQMISRILFGISDIIIHGSKWCENVGAGGLQAAVLGPATNDNISQVSIEAAKLGREM